jgi:hypothetical protein
MCADFERIVGHSENVTRRIPAINLPRTSDCGENQQPIMVHHRSDLSPMLPNNRRAIHSSSVSMLETKEPSLDLGDAVH